jgi:glucosamine-phosphate N-acetyltransferase
MSVRQLQEDDFHKEYMSLINIFTRNPQEVSFETFTNALSLMNARGSYVFVIEEDKRIVASMTLLIEQKLHNNCKKVGHIEDLVVHSEYRRRGFASELISFAVDLCFRANCYKVVLNTNAENVALYEKNGFVQKGIEMTKYYST